MGKHQSEKIRRQEIVAVATELFMNKGFEETSVDQIAKSAKVAKGLVYYYFKSKQEILNDVVLTMSERHIATLKQRIIDQSDDFKDRLLLLMDAYYEIHPLSDVSDIELIQTHIIFVDAFHTRYLEGIDDILNEIIAEGKKRGFFILEYPKEMILMTLEGIFGLMRLSELHRSTVITMIEQSLNLPEKSLLEKGERLLTHFRN